MPAHRIGRLWKFKLSEVDAWVAPAEPTKKVSRHDEGYGILSRKQRFSDHPSDAESSPMAFAPGGKPQNSLLHDPSLRGFHHGASQTDSLPYFWLNGGENLANPVVWGRSCGYWKSSRYRVHCGPPMPERRIRHSEK
jgi:hypothetical protein